MFKAEPFNACSSCPAPVSCNIRSACDKQLAIDLTAENTMLKARLKLTQDELCKANGALIASREEARQLRAGIDRMEALADYKTTQRFHQEQSRGVSIPAAELEVTREEDEAFAELALRVNRLENAYSLQQGRITTAHDRLDAIKESL